MKRKYLGIAVLLLLFSSSASAGPFVDSVIVTSKTFSNGSQGIIEVAIANDSAILGISLPLVITSGTGGAFGRVDSVRQLPSLLPFATNFSHLKVDGVNPDSLAIISIDAFFSGGTVPPGSRRNAYLIFVTNNSNLGTYFLDSNRITVGSSLKFAHPPVQASVPAYIHGVETIANQAGPFADSLWITREGNCGPGQPCAIVGSLANDFSISGFQIGVELKSLSGDFYPGKFDSVKFGILLFPPPTISLAKVNGVSPDTLIILWTDITGFYPIPPGPRREAVRLWVTNTGTSGCYQIALVDTRITHVGGGVNIPALSPPETLCAPQTAVRSEFTPGLPRGFALGQNVPNPFNPTTVITFALPNEAHVSLEVFNILGQKVVTLVNEQVTAGLKSIVWDGKDDQGWEIPSGIYFYRLQAGEFRETKRMVLLK